MPKRFLQFLKLISEQLFYIKDNIVIFYLPDLKKLGFSKDEISLILEVLFDRNIVKSYNMRYALGILRMPTDHQKKLRLLKGDGWSFLAEDKIKFQYIIELTSRDQFSVFYKTALGEVGVDKNAKRRAPDNLAGFEKNSDLSTLHPKILEKCESLFFSAAFPEAVEKGFKVVRDRLRELTTFEKGAEAFGKGGLHIKGAAAQHVDKDFNEGVKFLTMSIDMLRNEKSHTADAKIEDPTRAYEYLRLSSLAMHLLDDADATARQE